MGKRAKLEARQSKSRRSESHKKKQGHGTGQSQGGSGGGQKRHDSFSKRRDSGPKRRDDSDPRRQDGARRVDVSSLVTPRRQENAEGKRPDRGGFPRRDRPGAGQGQAQDRKDRFGRADRQDRQDRPGPPADRPSRTVRPDERPAVSGKPARGAGGGGPRAFLERTGMRQGQGPGPGPSKGKDKSKSKSQGYGKSQGQGKDQSRDRIGGGRPHRGRGGGKTYGDRTFVEAQGEIQKNAKGFAFLLQKPEDLFIPREFASKLITGDVVKVLTDSRTKEIIKLDVVKHTLKAFIGTYNAGTDRRVVMLTDRTMNEEVVIRDNPNLPELRHGHKVLVEITRFEPRLEGRITQTFGPELAPKHDTLAVVIRSQWPQEHSKEAREQAEKLSHDIQTKAASDGYPGRKDLREKPFVTIDGKDARDFDDAILVEQTKAGFVLYVAIADVSEFVQTGMKLDDEAYGRATSVYFPEWVIPMLPEALSNGACSLRPDEEKLTLTCEMHYGNDGKKRSAKIYESVIRSHRRCIYEDVQKEADAGDPFWKSPYELFRLIRTQRFKRGALDLDLPEAKVVLDDNSDTIDIKRLERVDAHKVIEEFMIAANESVTEIMEREGWPFVYRVHEPPQAAALERFERFAIALGLKPNLGGGADPKLFSKFIDSIRENPLATTLYYLMLRSLKQARYDPMNSKHFGLASQAYTHFTSPIRRYPDLMVHRILKRYVRREAYLENDLEEFVDYLAEACDFCSKQERKAEALDRTVIKVKKARFMARQLGEEFEAKITNVSETGVFIELVRWFVDGLVPIDELGGDYYEFIEQRLMLKGKRTGKKYRIGDAIRVTVLRTDVDNGFVDFTLAPDAEALAEDLEEEESEDGALQDR